MKEMNLQEESAKQQGTPKSSVKSLEREKGSIVKEDRVKGEGSEGESKE